MAEPVAPPPIDCSLAAFARELCRIDDYDALIELVHRELGTRFGLTNAWLYVIEHEDDEQALLVAVAGPKAATIREELPVAPTAADWFFTALRRNEGPSVIPDARDLAGNPEVARRLDNRTVVNVPIGVVDRTLGILGGGASATRGLSPSTRAQLPICCTSAAWRRWRSPGSCFARATRPGHGCRLSARDVSGWRAWGCWRAGWLTTSATCSPSSATAPGSSLPSPSARRSERTCRCSPRPNAAPAS